MVAVDRRVCLGLRGIVEESRAGATQPDTVLMVSTEGWKEVPCWDFSVRPSSAGSPRATKTQATWELTTEWLSGLAPAFSVTMSQCNL